jgi:hypothetical protein
VSPLRRSGGEAARCSRAFLISTIINCPASVVAILVIVVIGVIADLTWKRVRANRDQGEYAGGAAPSAP